MKSLTITAPALLLAFASTSYALDAPAKPKWAPLVGANGYLSGSPKDKLYAAADLACYQDLMQALNSGYGPSVKALIASDRIILIAAGTPVQVARTFNEAIRDGHPAAVQVLILDGRFAERKVWVPAAWIVEPTKREEGKKAPAKGRLAPPKAG